MGNTAYYLGADSGWEDHPHIHGEYRQVGFQFFHGIGSPPHTWGILTTLSLLTVSLRITPTYMGNTRFDKGHQVDLWDHPHIHGEYI